MLDAITWVKDALAPKDKVREYACVYFSDGAIWASDGRIVARHPFPYAGPPFMLMGEDFVRLATAAGPTATFAVADKTATIAAGKFKGTLKKVVGESWPMSEIVPPTEGWHPVDETFLLVLKTLRRFVSENASVPWFTCIGLEPGWALASNNVVVARMKMPDNPHTILFPNWAVDFVLSRATDLESWLSDGTSLFFQWKNGAFMRSASVVGMFPTRAQDMIAGQIQSKEQLVEVQPDFVAALTRIVGLLPDKGSSLRVLSSGVLGHTSDHDLEFEEASETLGLEGKLTLWGPKQLLGVMEVATTWRPSQYPSPAYWTGPNGLDGILLGKNDK